MAVPAIAVVCSWRDAVSRWGAAAHGCIGFASTVCWNRLGSREATGRGDRQSARLAQAGQQQRRVGPWGHGDNLKGIVTYCAYYCSKWFNSSCIELYCLLQHIIIMA